MVIKLILEYADLFGSVFKGRKVLVTGHTGFKGSWLSLWLDYLGATVIGYALEPQTQPSLFESLRLQEKVIHNTGDIRDLDHLLNVFDRYRPEIVFHLAAQSLVRRSYIEPRSTYETNIMGTVNILEAVRRSKSTQVVINVTSDKCYQNKEWEYAYRENDPMGGYDAYSSSKGCAELVTTAYYNSFFKNSGVGIASVRAGNVIGGGDWAEDRLVPDCIRALQRDGKILVRNPNAIRPWQYVLEPLSGYLWLASQMWLNNQAFNGPWNFGPHTRSNIHVKEIVQMVIKEWGGGSYYEMENAATQPHEARFLRLDCTKAGNQLGWHPIYDVEKTLQITTAWYKAYHNKEKDILDITLSDIDDYVDGAKKCCLAWALTSNLEAIKQ